MYFIMHLAVAFMLAGATAAQPDSWRSDGPELGQIWLAPEDDVPAVRHAFRAQDRGQHFLTGDEANLHVYEPYLRGIKGAFVGVGTDQCYLLAGWMRADLALLTDYDPLVQGMHRLYLAFLSAAATPEAFELLWRNAAAGAAALAAHHGQHAHHQATLRLYTQQRYRVIKRLTMLKRELKASRVKGFVNDQADYTWVRSMATGRRIRPMLANLLDTRAFQGVGAALTQVGLPVRALYLSNAESYWAYPTAFRANMRVLPFDERSWILRTSSNRGVTGDYRYFLQSPVHFLQRLADPKIRYVSQMAPFLPWSDASRVPLVVVNAVGVVKALWSASALVKS